MRSVVDLPQPEGPSSTMNSPSRDGERHVVDGGLVRPLVALAELVERDDGHRVPVRFVTYRPRRHALDQLLGEERVDQTTGMIAIIRPVAIMPMSSIWSPMKRWMPSGSVRLSSSVISTTA